ncbi:hypothetical protein COT87_01790 [Candidatus Collierbacteria bacterium CG10_big_fil_rev_8_21_14_0_10_44_9]|uniref:Amino acid transporter n=1 Tax=Candidatus Collierbacteria bacterium CG10_big_fil_rev_8_21_14_0_10_44_9 TaxID=1974535 RepID=A0A2H0VIT6_9BACT|nr:MAG: hypothetical protein COT87_01790 [Candidatus Collierbacteria bacterium CG10_big_fil_rev_8_21_14_0_10_44_9]
MSKLEQTKNTLNTILEHYKGFWAVAGGWAIDLYLGEVTRKHKDIEVAVWRDEQHFLNSCFASWNGKYLIKGNALEWNAEDKLELPIHELHFSKGDEEIEVLLNERKNENWVFRRDQTITYPENKFYQTTTSGIKILAPEVVLLYKAKDPKDHDTQDLHNALVKMTSEQKLWLHDSISKMFPQHTWLSFI